MSVESVLGGSLGVCKCIRSCVSAFVHICFFYYHFIYFAFLLLFSFFFFNLFYVYIDISIFL